MNMYAAQGVASGGNRSRNLSNDCIHFVLTFHGWCPTLEHRTEGASNSARWRGWIGAFQPSLSKSISCPTVIIKVAHTASYDNEIRKFVIVGKLVDLCIGVTSCDD